MAQKGPKLRELTENETITSYETWRLNLLYILEDNDKYAPFLVDDFQWKKKTAGCPHRGLQDDVAGTANGLTKQKKNALLDLMLGQIANWCPVIARNSIVKGSTSLKEVWQKIRQYYGFQTSGAHFLTLADFKLEQDERPERLYQRLYSFFEDNLLTKEGDVKHNGEAVEADEDMTPTLENTIAVLWLKLVHPGLPKLVKQKYGTELRNKSISSIKVEISQALPSLLDDLQSQEDAKVFRSSSFSNYRFKNTSHTQKKSFKSCVLCKTAGRTDTHWLSECKYLPEKDKRAIARTRAIQDVEESAEEDGESDTGDDECVGYASSTLGHSYKQKSSVARRVQSEPSPILSMKYYKHTLQVTLDSGATVNMIVHSAAVRYKIPIVPASQLAHQADGATPLNVVGEVRVTFRRGMNEFVFEALVVEKLDVDIIGGMPFMSANDISLLPRRGVIAIKQGLMAEEIVKFSQQRHTQSHPVRLTQPVVVRAPKQRSVLLPGDSLRVELPDRGLEDCSWIVEPRYDCKGPTWISPQEVVSNNNHIELHNITNEPVVVEKHGHICQVQPVLAVSLDAPVINNKLTLPEKSVKSCAQTKDHAILPYSINVQVDPDNQLTPEVRDQFIKCNLEYDVVFQPEIPLYNGSSGLIEGHVNMGPVLPPQRKGRMPQYNHTRLVELQDKCDELEKQGVFAKPEDMGITVEYLNLSFLVAKPNGGSRLVTSFGEVGQYSKPQPSLMPNVDDTLRIIGKWRYIVKTDLKEAFYQIPLSKASMKYCGIATPFKGVRTYTRCAMGMPGSETALEELMSRVIGHLIQEGIAAKLADDLYCGADTPTLTLKAWSRVLDALAANNLGISGPKTVICPRSTIILGWLWVEGTLQASPHRINALTHVEPPTTVRSLRSFIGAYKVLSRVLKGYAEKLAPFEHMVAGKESKESITWSEDQIQLFRCAQTALNDTKIITIPQPSDVLWLVTDAACTTGLGATLYTMRNEQLKVAGFFNAQCKRNQVGWLPCELEALSIASSVTHFAPYIIQCVERCRVLTDNRPCVLAYKKLCRGEFSNSSRVTAFLSAVNRYQVTVGHIAGAENELSDYGSRNPVECDNASCQVCKFIEETQDTVIRAISMQDVTDGRTNMPFANRPAWISTQQECPDLRRVHAHLKQGTRPSKKQTTVNKVKRYLQSASIARDGLLVVRNSVPFQPAAERIIIPEDVVHGVITAIHIKFNHPSSYQMKRFAGRYFYALGFDRAVDEVVSACHHCNALKSIPTEMIEQSTMPPPDIIGSSYAVDVMKRYRQLVLVMRECVTSFTMTSMVDSETKQELRTAIIVQCFSIRGPEAGSAHIRIDPGPGLASLVGDDILKEHGIILDLGRIKNINKNPVAEKAVEELGLELLNIAPDGGPISKITLAQATSILNSRIRGDGLSARELWTQRDQVTGDQLAIEDRSIIMSQHIQRMKNHAPSSKSKGHSKPAGTDPIVNIGSLVYLKCDRDKTRGREKYIVTAVSDKFLKVRKFAKSQFRNKTYDIKISECYLIQPNVLSHNCPGPVRGVEKQAADNGSDSDMVEISPHNIPSVLTNSPEVEKHVYFEHPETSEVHDDNVWLDHHSDHYTRPDDVEQQADITTPVREPSHGLNAGDDGTANNSSSSKRPQRNRCKPKFFHNECY